MSAARRPAPVAPVAHSPFTPEGATVADKNLITRVARWSATHAWLAILGWLAFVVLCLVVNAAVGTVPATSNDYRVGEAGRAEQLTTDAGMPGAEYERVLITAKDGQTASPADLDAAAADVTQPCRPSTRSGRSGPRCTTPARTPSSCRST